MTTFQASDNLGYFETIQTCFTELTRRAIFLSGRDLQLLERWREQGATATAICKGLREAVEAMPDDDPPRDVYACRHYIEPYVEQVRARRVGGHEQGEADGADELNDAGADAAYADGLVDRALDKIERAGRRSDDRAITELYRRAWREIRSLRDQEGRLERLAAIEEGLADGYYRALDREAQSDIVSRIEEDSGDLLERMSADAREEHLRARRRRILMEEFDLISLLD